MRWLADAVGGVIAVIIGGFFILLGIMLSLAVPVIIINVLMEISR